MTLGRASGQGDLLDQVASFCEGPVGLTVFGLLAREREQMFPDVMFGDLFVGRGRWSVPPSIVATVMVLQRLEGLSDQEAVDRFTFDLRWKYAAGVSHDHPPFGRTVLVYFRQRLRQSGDPDRIFRVSTELARNAGLVRAKRVLDSAPLFDAVATQDTVTLIRGAIRGVLRVSGALDADLRSVLARDDDYRSPGKPVCDWDDPDARELMIDELVNDGMELLVALDERELAPDLARAGALLGTVIGQDIALDDDGVFRIWRGTAKDRVISVVDPDARHGHKSSRSGFDGYKGHIAIDPDSEIITAACVGPANAGDGEMAAALLDDIIPTDTGTDTGDRVDDVEADADGAHAPAVYGDNAYSGGPNLDLYERSGLAIRTKTPHPHASGGRFPKDRFDIDLDAESVTCPAGHSRALTGPATGARSARFASACPSCPLRSHCTTSSSGRTIRVGPYERQLTDARRRQQDPAWQADYQATRPKVERKLAHLLRRQHGGRKARVKGLQRVDQDWKLKAAAVNLARLAVLGLRSHNGTWTAQRA